MRFHVLSLPHTQTNSKFSSCAYTNKVIGFSTMMTNLGHEVFLYSGDRNTTRCSEHISCLSESRQKSIVGNLPYTSASFDYTLPHWINYNTTIIKEIEKRIAPTDFICIIAGFAQKQVSDAFPNHISVEFGVGYGGHYLPYKVFESYAWMHTCYGTQSPCDAHNIDGNWYDTVIPGYLNINDFPYKDKKDDYLLYLGRIIDRKGIGIVRDIQQATGKKVIIAGPGEDPGFGEYIGEINSSTRGELLSNASALIAPTIYIEPFGNVVIEAHACGTPTITTDWGAFTETNIDGVTGFRCRTLKEFCEAIYNVNRLSPPVIRKLCTDRYSLEVVGIKYQTYFERLLNLWNRGWYEL